MNTNRRRPHSAAVPGGAGRGGVGYYLFEDTYGHQTHALPPRRLPTPAPASAAADGDRHDRSAASSRSRSRNRNSGHPQQQQQQQQRPHRPPLVSPPTPPAGGAARRRQERKAGGARRSHGTGTSSPGPRQPGRQPPPPPSSADAVAFRIFNERRHSGQLAAVPAAAAGRDWEGEGDAGGGLVRPSASRRPAGISEPSQHVSGSATRVGTQERAIQPGGCAKLLSRPTSSLPPATAGGGADVRDSQQPHPYSSDSESDASAVAGSRRHTDDSKCVRGTSAATAVGVAERDEGTAEGDTVLLSLVADQSERELCHRMAEFLSILAPHDAGRVLAAVQQESEAQRLLPRYGGAYDISSDRKDKDGNGDGKAELMAHLGAKWAAVKDTRAAEQREARRRTWVHNGPAPAGSGASAAAAAASRSGGGAERHRKLLAQSTLSPSARATSASGPAVRVANGSGKIVTGSAQQRLGGSGSRAPTVPSPSLPRPPARKGRYPSPVNTSNVADDSTDDAWLQRQQQHGDADSDAGDEAEPSGAIGFPLFIPEHQQIRRSSYPGRASADTTAALVESPDAYAARRRLPLTMRLDEGVLSEPAVVVRADDGTEVTLTPGAAAARAAYMAAHPGKPYRLPAHVTGEGSRHSSEGSQLGGRSSPVARRGSEDGEDEDGEASGVGDRDAVLYNRSQRESEDERAAFEKAAERSGTRFDHGGDPDPSLAAAPKATVPPAYPGASPSRHTVEFPDDPSANDGSAGDSVLKSTTLADMINGPRGVAAGSGLGLRIGPGDGHVDGGREDEQSEDAAAPAARDNGTGWDFTTSTGPPPSDFADTRGPTHAQQRQQMQEDQLRFYTSDLHTTTTTTTTQTNGSSVLETGAPADFSVAEHRTDKVDSLDFGNEADFAAAASDVEPAEHEEEEEQERRTATPLSPPGDDDDDDDAQSGEDADFEVESVEEVEEVESLIEETEGTALQGEAKSAEEDMKLPWDD